MDDPHRTYPVVHVAGTNGKSSTVRIAAEIIGAHGLGVGTFTSPHLERIEQRFSAHGREMTADEFAAAMADVAPFVELFEQQTGDGVTYFELTAALAFAWFAERAVEAAIVEVGLGGRLDATNVVDARVAVVTGIAMDHAEYLGNTPAAIAGEKVAILGPGAVLVSGSVVPDAEAVLAARVEATGSTWRRFEHDFGVDALVQAVGGWSCDIDGVYDRYDELYLPLHGRHQVHNLAVAVAAAEELFGRSLDPEAVRVGAGRAAVPGRLEVVRRSPLVVIDGAHNPDGIAALAAALEEEFLPSRWSVVFGVRGERDPAELLELLRPAIGAVHAARADDGQAVPAAAVAEAARAVLDPDIEVVEHPTVAAAVDAALATAGDNGAVLVTGSLYVIGEARTHLGVATSARG